MTRSTLVGTTLLLACLCAPSVAQERGLIANMGTCAVTAPRLWIAVDAASTSSCGSGGGSSQVLCLCTGGVWSAVISGSARMVSFDNPPASAGAYDCEFASGLSNSWALSGTVSAGTVSPISTASGDPVVDYSSWPGWALFQSDESSGSIYGAKRTGVSQATTETWFAHLTYTARDLTAAEGEMFMTLQASGDANEGVYVGLMNLSGGLVIGFGKQDNGTYSLVYTIWPADRNYPAGSLYVALVKTSNDYHGFAWGADLGAVVYLGSTTKTGTTAFNTVAVYTVTANDSPRIITGVDFVRYYGSATFVLANP